jgi:hypothetical protein
LQRLLALELVDGDVLEAILRLGGLVTAGADHARELEHVGDARMGLRVGPYADEGSPPEVWLPGASAYATPC